MPIHRSVLLQVSVTKADQELGFAIQTCFISPYSNPDRMSDYTIIENICPKDESVKFYDPKRVHFPIPQAETDKKRFSFVFKPVFNTSLLFLQCELTLCTKREKEPQKLPKVSGFVHGYRYFDIFRCMCVAAGGPPETSNHS